jgi:hypothetical protein
MPRFALVVGLAGATCLLPGLLGRHALALGLATCVVPAVGGWLLGAFVVGSAQRSARARAAAGAVLAALVLVGTYVFAAVEPTIAVWDVCVGGLFGAAGVLAGAYWGIRRLPVGKLALACGIPLVILELAGRFVFPPATAFPPPSEATLRVRTQELDRRCVLVDDSVDPRWHADQVGRPPFDRSRVLHFGDSLVYGALADGSPAFSDILDREYPGVVHVNAGLPGSSPDTHVSLLARMETEPDWVPEFAIYYTFTNDLVDAASGYLCCGGRSMVTVGADGLARSSCMEPDWTGALAARMSRSRAPLVLRELGRVSAGARLLLDGLASIQWGFTLASEATRDEADRIVVASLRAMSAWFAERDIPFAVVTLPARGLLEEAVEQGNPEVHEIHAIMLELVRAAGLEPHDPWDVLYSAVADDLDGLWTDQEGPRDPHFGRQGHELMARWLLEQFGDRWPVE